MSANLKLHYSKESYGTYGSYHIQILLDEHRELSDPEKEAIWKAADIIENAVMEERIKNNPEAIQRAASEKEKLLGLFGSRAILVKAIPNGYCSRYCCKHLPWFEVTTSMGTITIGWRKRVISIDWGNVAAMQAGGTSMPPEYESKNLFPNEDVTKGEFSIHAWGYEKAQEYINKILA